MTILPKKKPASTVGVTDHSDDPDRRNSTDPHPHAHQHANRTGSRPRASPPPWPYQAAPHTSREDRRIEATSRPQQASPQQPVVAGGSSVGPCESSTSAAVTCVVGTRGELACASTVGSCCSGPGLSKRRRQTACSSTLPGGGGGGGPGTENEEGAGGNNSEDEYENAASQQSVDPATAEQVKCATCSSPESICALNASTVLSGSHPMGSRAVNHTAKRSFKLNFSHRAAYFLPAGSHN